jgi:hypothetical protein
MWRQGRVRHSGTPTEETMDVEMREGSTQRNPLTRYHGNPLNVDRRNGMIQWNPLNIDRRYHRISST